MKRTLRGLKPLWREERGAALPLALLALVVLGALSAVLLTVGSSEVQIAANHLGGTQASFMAEAGLEDAFNVFRTTPTLVSSAPTGPAAVPGLAGPGATLTAYGGYTVQYQASGPNTVMVVATGTTTGGAQKVLRATLSTSFVSNDAILTGGSLTISGNPDVEEGGCGSVHANQNLTISGNPEVEGDATASGTYLTSGSPEIGGASGGAYPEETIPVINPADFLTAAQTTRPATEVFQMKSDGWVLDGNGFQAIEAPLLSGQSFNGWKYTTSGPLVLWDYRGTGSSAHTGTYYLEGNAKVSGNPGSDESPWVVTIIATKNIEISGNPDLSPHLTDTLLVAGYDIKISGNFEQHAPGLIAAHEQISISGNPVIQGVIIAEDASAISPFVTSNSISGTPSITYDCGLNPPLQGPLQMLAWGI